MTRMFCRMWILLVAMATQVAAQPPTASDDDPSLPPLIVEEMADPEPDEPPPDPDPTPQPSTFGIFDSTGGRAADLIGSAGTASEGLLDQADIQSAPLERTSDLLNLVPGMIGTTHSGSGKGGLFFLRGFTLDHGTDFQMNVDGVLVNLHTHAHGHGYLDFNFVIPELIERIEYKKGPYYAEVGEFGSAGAAFFHTARTLDGPIIKGSGGSYGYYRGLIANSAAAGSGNLLYAFETKGYDGPWTDLNEDFRHFNGVLKYSAGDEYHGGAITFSSHYAEWFSTDQIPNRLIDTGQLDRFGAFDPTQGGRTGRHGVNVQWWTETECSRTDVNAFGFAYDLDLWGNATGEQTQQFDNRGVTGVKLKHRWETDHGQNTIGATIRNDWITHTGTRETDNRVLARAIVDDRVMNAHAGLFYEKQLVLTERLRLIGGVRGDMFYYDIQSRLLDVNSGEASDGVVTPKFSAIYGVSDRTDVYVSGGLGFRSNDARSVVIVVNPSDPTEPPTPQDQISNSRGIELGLRTTPLEGWQATLAAYYIELDASLIFEGAEATTEPFGASRRQGIEITNFYRPTNWLTMNFDIAYADVEFTEFVENDEQRPGLGGFHVPGAMDLVIGAGANVLLASNLTAGLALRHFGDRPISEDGSIQAPSTTIVNFHMAYDCCNWNFGLDVLNLLDSNDNAIEFLYRSDIADGVVDGNEVLDRHIRPLEPFAIRAYATYSY